MKYRLEFVKKVFGPTASHYEARIGPAFRQFAAGVMQTADPQGHEIALDVGTGTGILARLMAPRVRHVTGVDIVGEMISQARHWAAQDGLTNVDFQEADAHKLPFESEKFDLIVSSFGLNATYPTRVLPELRRVLKPDGRLAFHEWHEEHPLDSLMIDVLVKFMVEDEETDDSLIEMRDYLAAPRPWDNVFQTGDDYREELEKYGFSQVQVWEDQPVMCILSIEDFMAYKLAWTPRQMELAAMDEWRRADCLDTLRAALQTVSQEGYLYYAPKVFRILVTKKS